MLLLASEPEGNGRLCFRWLICIPEGDLDRVHPQRRRAVSSFILKLPNPPSTESKTRPDRSVF